MQCVFSKEIKLANWCNRPVRIGLDFYLHLVVKNTCQNLLEKQGGSHPDSIAANYIVNPFSSVKTKCNISKWSKILLMECNYHQVEQCRDCDGGFYCDVEAATNVSGVCMAGYYCESGIDRANPNNAETNSTYPPSCPLLGGHTGTK